MVLATPLAELVQDRRRVLGLTRETLGYRLGYTNPAKAAGRVDALCSEPPFNAKTLRAIQRLPVALEIEPEVVERAVTITERLHVALVAIEQERRLREAERAEAAWRVAFKPHAVLLTEELVPRSIAMCAATGGARRWLYIALDTSRPPVSFVPQVLTALPERIWTAQTDRCFVPLYGAVLGFVVNFAPDNAVHCDLEGRPLQALTRAFRPGVFGLPIDAPPPLFAGAEG